MLMETLMRKQLGLKAHGDESGRGRRIHDRPHRSAGRSATALRGLRAAVPEGAQRAQGTRMARPTATFLACLFSDLTFTFSSSSIGNVRFMSAALGTLS
jgi:hypothetical protein